MSPARSAAAVAALLSGVAACVLLPAAVRSDPRLAATAAFVARLEPPADLVWVHPDDRTDLAGRLGGVPAVAAGALDEASLAAFPRVLVVGAGDPASAVRALARLDDARITRLDVPGGLPAWRIEPGAPYRVLARLSDLLPQARVSLAGPDGERSCPWDPGRRRFRCPGPTFLWVGKTREALGGVRRQCVWAHPPPGGSSRKLLISLGNQGPIRLATRIALGLGLTDYAAQCRTCAPVDVELEVASGGEVVPHRFAARGRGLTWERVDTAPGPGSVRLLVSAADAAARHFCLDLEIRDTP